MSPIAFDYNAALATLAPTFQTAIKATVDAESQPIKQTQTQKDAITVQRSMYADMKTNLDGLQTAVQALISDQAFYGLKQVVKPSITPGVGGGTVLTVSTDDSAISGDYDIVVSKLAKAQSRATSMATSPDIALGKSGTFWMGGTGVAVLQTETSPGVFTNFVPNDSVTDAFTSTVADGQRELGSGTYSLQVRDSGLGRQFRLVNADGTAVSIRSKDGVGYTTGWQAMTGGSFDTGRGLNLALNSSGSAGSTNIQYTAKGVSINIFSTDTQRNIASAINGVLQPEGHDFKASIIGGQLVLTGAQTGINHAMLFTDSANLGFGSDLQSAQNAAFTVNGMSVSRATNSNLMDVIDGVTLNLANDAEAKSAHLSITGSADNATSAMNSLVGNFNSAFTYLTGKMATTSKTTGSTTTYTRGPLKGDTVFQGLRTSMFSQVNSRYANSGSFKSLADIGLTFDGTMKLSLDSAKFSDAVLNHASDLKAILDTAMGRLNTTLSQHTGTTGSLQKSMDSMDNQLKSYDQKITKLNDSIKTRQQSLVEQYQAMQTTLAEMGYQAQMFGINISGGYVTGSSNLNLLT
jgi:flagellar capping protein FliD